MRIKALSFRQPWAELILRGDKTLDLRTWSTAHRGPLAVYASTTVEQEACRAHRIDPAGLTTSAVVGVVVLVGILPLDESAYRARQGEHLSGRPFRETLYGWELARPRRLAQPVPARGRLRLFEVTLAEERDEGPLRETEDKRQRTSDKGRTDAEPPPLGDGWDPQKPFELRVVPTPNTGQPAYRLALYQRVVEPPAAHRSLYTQPLPPMERVVELGGAALRAVADLVLEALRANGYKPTDLSAGRRSPFALAEEDGVRLGLVFLAGRPLTRMERVEAIAQGIRAMTSEELYYWYSKCSGGRAAARAQKALRVLLAAE